MDTDITFTLTISETNYQARTQREFTTKEEAQALADTMPKWMNAKVSSIGRATDGGFYRASYFVQCWAPLWQTGKTGRNEAGIKRLHKLLANYRVEYVSQYTDGRLATLDEALAAVGAA